MTRRRWSRVVRAENLVRRHDGYKHEDRTPEHDLRREVGGLMLVHARSIRGRQAYYRARRTWNKQERRASRRSERQLREAGATVHSRWCSWISAGGGEPSECDCGALQVREAVQAGML